MVYDVGRVVVYDVGRVKILRIFVACVRLLYSISLENELVPNF